MGYLDRQPRGAMRLLLRAPLLIYRAGLGRVLGSRFVYLAHAGRKTGLRRETVLEVVGFDTARPEVVVAAAWGGRSDWFRNIQAAPAIELRIAGHRWQRPSHRLLPVGERDAVLRAYRRSHPWAWRYLAPILNFPRDPDDPAWPDAVAGMEFVGFRPQGAAG